MRTTEKSITNNHFLPVLIIILGGIIRFITAIVWGYSNDELSAISRSFYDSWGNLISLGVMETDFHPAGVQVFISIWQSLFGTAEWVMRLPFIVVSCFGLYFFYRFFEIFWNQKTRIIFVILFSFLFFPIEHTLFARPYAFGLFFTGLALYGVYQLIRNDVQSWKWALVCALGWTGILYTHYFAALFSIWLALCLVLIIPKNKLLFFIGSGVLAGLLFIPHIDITLHHLDQGGLGWLPPPEKTFPLEFLYHVFNESIGLILLLAATIIIGLYLKIRDRDFSTVKPILWNCAVFIGIFTIAYLYSIQKTPILKFMVLLFPFPFLLVVIAHFLVWPYKKLKGKYYALIAAVLLISTVFTMRLWNPTAHFGVFRELAEHTVKWQKEYGSDQITQVTNLNAPYYLDFYLQKQNTDIDSFSLTTIDFQQPQPFFETIQKSKTPYFAYSYSNHPHLARYFEQIRTSYPTMIEGYQYFNSGIWLFSREASERSFKKELDYPQPDLQDSSGWKIIPAQGFTPAVPFQYKDLDIDRYDYLLLTVEVYTPKDGKIALVGAGQENEKIIQYNGSDYYQAQDYQNILQPQKVSLAFDVIPEHLSANSQLVFYLWNNGNTPVYVKNIALKVVDPEVN